jgi:hypothetical protein
MLFWANNKENLVVKEWKIAGIETYLNSQFRFKKIKGLSKLIIENYQRKFIGKAEKVERRILTQNTITIKIDKSSNN